jgi:hypothetical protein
MAMRDPGTPGRNPFFDHGPEPADPEPAGPETDDLAPDGPAADRPGGSDPRDPDPDFWEHEFPWDTTATGRDPLGTLANLIDALQEVQPEATEHLVTAAHELVLAVKCVVDATESVLAAQRANAAPEPPERDRLLREDADAEPEPEAPPRSSGVRRIDLA